jgi:hypothetical protein
VRKSSGHLQKDGLISKEVDYMSISMSFHKHSSGQTDERSPIPMPLPIVYENVPLEPTHWEYRVLTIDTREETLPGVALLNELGNEGWLLVGMLDEKTNARSALVYYYFVRQKME